MDQSKPNTEILDSDENIKNFALKLTGSYIGIRAFFKLFSYNLGDTSFTFNMLFTFLLPILFDIYIFFCFFKNKIKPITIYLIISSLASTIIALYFQAKIQNPGRILIPWILMNLSHWVVALLLVVGKFMKWKAIVGIIVIAIDIFFFLLLLL